MNIIIKDMKKLLLSMLLGMASLFANAITWNSNYISIRIGNGDFSELIKLKTVILIQILLIIKRGFIRLIRMGRFSNYG